MSCGPSCASACTPSFGAEHWSGNEMAPKLGLLLLGQEALGGDGLDFAGLLGSGLRCSVAGPAVQGRRQAGLVPGFLAPRQALLPGVPRDFLQGLLRGGGGLLHAACREPLLSPHFPHPPASLATHPLHCLPTSPSGSGGPCHTPTCSLPVQAKGDREAPFQGLPPGHCPSCLCGHTGPLPPGAPSLGPARGACGPRIVL